MSRKVYFVTGMHRSGTSHLASRMRDWGIPFPGEMLPAADDNPGGYWESRDIVSLNNDILGSVGLTWRSLGPLPCDFVQSPGEQLVERAAKCLHGLEECNLGTDFAIKDPRLCRLLPVWRKAAERRGLVPHVVASLRDPGEVAASLFHRLRDPRFSPAAIDVPGTAELLSLRYLLDLERFSRGMLRRFVRYTDIKKYASFESLLEEKPTSLGHFEPLHERQTWGEVASRLAELMVSPKGKQFADTVDSFACKFDRDTGDLPGVAASSKGPSFDRAAAALQAKPHAAAGARRPRIAFLSGAPDSRGHIYRIENRIASLRTADAGVVRVDPQHWTPEDVIQAADIVIVFRMEMSRWLDSLMRLARQASVTVVFDLDDLVIDPDLMRPEIFRFLQGKPAEVHREWQSKAGAWRQAAAAADFCWATTAPLAGQLLGVNPNVRILPNGLSDHSVRMERKVHAVRSSRNTDEVILSYASGTPTHDQDFAQIVEPLLEVLSRFPKARLSVTGHVSEEVLRPLAAIRARVDLRPFVGYYDLPLELARADINLAPLELENPFCECKSELKVFESAIVGVPTIASPTSPYVASVEPAVTGLLARTPADWLAAMTELVCDRSARERMGAAARDASNSKFGPARQRSDLKVLLRELEAISQGELT